jgi:hypothetical protein
MRAGMACGLAVPACMLPMHCAAHDHGPCPCTVLQSPAHSMYSCLLNSCIFREHRVHKTCSGAQQAGGCHTYTHVAASCAAAAPPPAGLSPAAPVPVGVYTKGRAQLQCCATSVVCATPCSAHAWPHHGMCAVMHAAAAAAGALVLRECCSSDITWDTVGHKKRQYMNMAGCCAISSPARSESLTI